MVGAAGDEVVSVVELDLKKLGRNRVLFFVIVSSAWNCCYVCFNKVSSSNLL